MIRHLFWNKLSQLGGVLGVLCLSVVVCCSPPDFARFQDSTYVSTGKFDYSDLASSSSGSAHSQGATVAITCSTTSSSGTPTVEGFDQQRESISASGGLVATCTNVGGSQYTWTINGRILQFVDCR
ncbi:hypothetical protein M3Y99_00784700 [Aphelenchoides fujianensis]|nr:hypothetical protein M3Y99_00784700 [Aphelenchoides fujianensis]